MQPSDFDRSFRSARLFLPAAREVLGRHLAHRVWQEAPLDIDRREATDLLTLQADLTTVAFRVRDVRYLRDYPLDFTLRDSRPSGAKTEFEKIRDGFAKFYLYAFAHLRGGPPMFVAWRLLDLDVFREQLLLNVPPLTIKHGIPNGDGSSTFAAIDSTSLDPRCTVAKHPPNRAALVPPDAGDAWEAS